MKTLDEIFPRPYGEMKAAVKEFVKDGDRILDIGCGSGLFEKIIEKSKKGCDIDAVDINKKAIEELRGTPFPNSKVRFMEEDANKFLRSFRLKKYDIILANAVLHGIWTGGKEDYLDGFFKRLGKMLAPGGLVLLGEYFYPETVGDKEAEKFTGRLKRLTGHGDARSKFIDPKIICQKALENKFHIAKFDQMRAVKEIDRKYFIFVLQKS